MGVEVSGHVEGGSVVAAGDTVTVSVTVTASAQMQNCHSESQDDSSGGELVSWCSAQIHCICTCNEAHVITPTPQQPAAPTTGSQGGPGTPGTSFAPWRGETGHLVLTTKPTILFCELLLPPGHSRTFTYRETVPCSAPPSYRGHNVKYAWKVTVGAQRHGSKIALIRLPLRVMLLPQPSPGALESAYSESEEELSPSNPFLHPTSHTPTTPPSALLQAWPSRSVRAYNIVHSRGHVVKFSIFRSSYKLGDDILATLDFMQGQIPCVQYSVCLQSVEDISSEYCVRRSRQCSSVVSYSKTHELCLSMSHTSFLLPVPLHITPAFEADMVTLQYRLHFEFVLSLNDSNKKALKANKKASKNTINESSTNSSNSGARSPDSKGSSSSISSTDTVNSGSGGGGSGGSSLYEGESGWQTEEDGSQSWRAPHQLDIETLVWDLPINIGPSPPAHLSAALNLPESFAQMVV